MSSRPPRRPGELTFSLILVVFSALAFWQAYGISGFTGYSTAGVFPMLAAATLIVTSLVILAGTLRRPAASGKVGTPAMRFVREVLPLRHVIVFVMVLAYLALLPWLGFVASSGLFLFTAFQFLWRRHPALSLATAAVSLGAIYFIFRVVFQVVLPEGTLLRGII